MDDQTQQKKDNQGIKDQVALVSFIDDLIKEKMIKVLNLILFRK